MGTAKNIVSLVLALAGGLLGFCAMTTNKVSDFFYSGANARWMERGGVVALLLLCTALILVFLRSDKGEAKDEKDDAAPAAPAADKPAEPEKPA